MLRETHLEQDLQRSEMLLGNFRRRRIFTRWQSRHFRLAQAQSLTGLPGEVAMTTEPAV